MALSTSTYFQKEERNCIEYRWIAIVTKIELIGTMLAVEDGYEAVEIQESIVWSKMQLNLQDGPN